MKLLCPTCQKPLEVPEQYAGQMMKCPLCANTFTVPVLAQMPGAAAPPPPPVRPEKASDKFPVHQPAPQYQPSGQGRGITISPRLVPWLAPLSLVALCILFFLPWVGLFPGGVDVLTQSGFEVAISGTTTKPKWVEYNTDARAQYWKDTYGTDLDPFRDPGPSWAIILFMVLLFPATLAALASVAMHTRLVPMEVPQFMAPFWPLRSLFVGSLVLGILIFLAIELFQGFPLEGRVATAVNSAVNAKRDAADPSQKLDDDRWKIERGIRLGGFVLKYTNWLVLVICLTLLALLGAILEYWIERRGAVPPPRLEIV